MPTLLVPILMAGAPLIVGVIMIVRARRGGRARPACGECGFTIDALDGKATDCPSCGRSFAEAGIVSDRSAMQPGMFAGGVLAIMIGAGCLGGGVIAQRASLRAAREAEIASEEARERANAAIESLIAQGRAEALENPAEEAQEEETKDEETKDEETKDEETKEK